MNPGLKPAFLQCVFAVHPLGRDPFGTTDQQFAEDLVPALAAGILPC